MLGKAFAAIIGLLLLAQLPSVGAQVPGVALDNTVMVPDAPKAVQFQAGTRSGTPAQNASQVGPQFDHLDILKVVVGQETENDFKVQLHLAALDQAQPNAGFPFRLIYFSYGALQWQIFVGGCRQFGQTSAPPETAGCLMYKDNPAAQGRAVKTIPAEKANGAFTFTIAKTDIFNEQRLPAQYGQSLSDIYAVATQIYATTAFIPGADVVGHVSAMDRAPDGGFSKTNFVFSKGSGGHGALGLTSPDPVRVSNGEATTIVYLSQVHNKGEQDLKVQLTSKDARSDWSVRVPPILDVPAGKSVDFPVILTIPFTHEHGKTIMFKVRADAVEDPSSYAEMQLGVWWTDVPQPSAHHNGELWFHSAPADFQAFPDQGAAVAPFKQYWFNSIEADPNPAANDEGAPAFFNDYFFCPFSGGSATPDPTKCQTPPNFTASWFFPLNPQLLIGLDFDLTKTALLQASILSSLPSTTARLEAEVRYCNPETGTGSRFQSAFQNATACNNYPILLAKGSVSNTLGAKSEARFEVPLTIEPTADFIPFKRGANIGLSVKLVSDIPQNLVITEPRPVFDIKKSKLFLPLIEYHDAIDESFEEIGAIQVSPLDPFEKKVNPGRTTLFHFDVENRDDTAQKLRLEIEGVNPEWATIVGPAELNLEKNERANFTVAVMAPGDAVDEERAELFVIAQSVDEPELSGLGRLRATVTTNGDIPDEAGQIQSTEKKDTPTFGVLVAILTVAGTVLLRRRRA